MDSKIDLHPALQEEKEVQDFYPVSDGESLEEKTYFAYNFSVCKAEDSLKVLAADILEYMLMETPASPLRKALIEKGVGKDVMGYFYDGIRQPALSIIVKNSDSEKKALFRETVREVCSDLVKNGFDGKLLESAINKKEFKMREADFRGFPKGLVYNIAAMNGWLYDLKPYLYLEFEDHFKRLRELAADGYFEKLLQEVIVENGHSVLFQMSPRRGMVEEKTKALEEKLEEVYSSMTDEERNELKAGNKALKEWQNTPDSAEDLEKLPGLSVEDIRKTNEVIDHKVYEMKEGRVVAVEQPTNGIVYTGIYSLIPEGADPACVSLAASLLGAIDTSEHSYEELSKETDSLLGNLDFDVKVFPEIESPEEPMPRFVVSARYLGQNRAKAMDLVNEVLNKAVFDNKKRIKEIIQEVRSGLESGLMAAGHRFALLRLSSYYSGTKHFEESVSGKTYYDYIRDLDMNFDERWPGLKGELEKTYASLFNRDGMLISVTTDHEVTKEDAVAVWEEVVRGMNDEAVRPFKGARPDKNLNEALAIPGQVQYVAKGYNFRRLGYKYTGAFSVLANILRFGYLWNRVRVNGGAYGVFSVITRDGDMAFCSYRDPQLSRTLEVYDGIPGHVSAMEPSDDEMLKYIIGAISDVDRPLTPPMKGEKVVNMILKGVSDDDLQRERDEILSCTKEDLKNASAVIRDVLGKAGICVVGSEKKIDDDSDIFLDKISVFQ